MSNILIDIEYFDSVVVTVSKLTMPLILMVPLLKTHKMTQMAVAVL